MSHFITGTDTAVGKTHVAALLVSGLRKAAVDAVGFKPICCGGRQDAEELRSAGGDALDLNTVNPVWLRPPAAPYAAAMIESRSVDIDLIRKTFARLRADHATVIVEGCGGWLVPVAPDFSMSDLAAEFALPVLVVAANRLGVINHTLLTVSAIKRSGLQCAGVLLNHPHPCQDIDPAVVTNRAVIEELLDVPVLGEVAYGDRELPASVLRALSAASSPP